MTTDAAVQTSPLAAQAASGRRSLSVRQLMVRRFCRNRVALVSLIILAVMYVAMAAAELVSPYSPTKGHDLYLTMPPQGIHVFDENWDFHWPPFTYRQVGKRDFRTLTFVYERDGDIKDPVRLFVRGDSYTFLGLQSDRHLFGTEEGTIFLLGTDARGRDMLSRIIHGSRVTLTIGLIGVALVIMLGAVIGAVSGYLGGIVDSLVQRMIEIFRLFPPIPLWMALAAALPPSWPSTYVFFGIIVTYGLIMWPGLAREVRGLVLVLRESEFVLAAEASGASLPRIIRKHLIPNMATHLLVTATLGIPVVIIFESTLSFFGLGIQPPMVSWGLLLQQAQKLEVLNFYPWLLAPGAFIVVAVLLFNFVGDGVRDAADPYS